MVSSTMALTVSQAVDGFLPAKRAEGKSPNILDQYNWPYLKFTAFLVTVQHLSEKSRHSIQVALSSLWTWAT